MQPNNNNNTTTATPSSDHHDIYRDESGNKVFGMENFGNTCYCNSVLQCLYHSKLFRQLVMAYPPPQNPSYHTKLDNTPLKQKPTRLTVPGLSPHPFTLDPNTTKLSTSASTGNANNTNINTHNQTATSTNGNAKSDSANTQSSTPQSPQNNNNQPSQLGRRISIFGKKSNHKATIDSPSPTNLPANASSSDTSDSNQSETLLPKSDAVPPTQSPTKPTLSEVMTTLFADSSTLYPASHAFYPGLKGIELGIRYPGQNIPVVGFTDDPYASAELRKRNALIKGPIINLDLSYTSYYNMKDSLFTSIKDVFECMAEHQSRIGVVAPVKLIEVLKRENELFRSSMHQDAHEFLNFLLNQVIETIESLTKSRAEAPSEATGDVESMDTIFQGILTSETKCLTCETVSRRDEQFLDISIDIERNSSVTSCLRQFSASEMLSTLNKFYCDQCGGLHEAEKRTKIKKLPKILALHLKRFKYTEDLQRNVKLSHRVVYPKYLRLDNTAHDATDKDKLYELYAVVVHIGGGPYYGHYVSVVKTETSGWLMFDDEMVEAVDPTYVFNFFGDNKGLATAYVLFYQEITHDQYVRENLYINNVPPVPPTGGPTKADSKLHMNSNKPCPPVVAKAGSDPISLTSLPEQNLQTQTNSLANATCLSDETRLQNSNSLTDFPKPRLTRSNTTANLDKTCDSPSSQNPPLLKPQPTRRKSVNVASVLTSHVSDSGPSSRNSSGLHFWKKKDSSLSTTAPTVDDPSSNNHKKKALHLPFSFKKQH